ncbi:unnamed protein product (plasmid) [Mycetohabitans rhizoxinica HKI 454]|uniref:Uncharacterized protein n=1 Tax=Mycetohabitans rhizoxinica (strain DSM 19002 / CIP 109453 / HKI 454) TaxID=882378 RepID=E5AUW0_MYCRK|nr:unnamed protein product [Mycetohabitans rhizoxinica HKI 454]
MAATVTINQDARFAVAAITQYDACYLGNMRRFRLLWPVQAGPGQR